MYYLQWWHEGYRADDSQGDQLREQRDKVSVQWSNGVPSHQFPDNRLDVRKVGMASDSGNPACSNDATELFLNFLLGTSVHSYMAMKEMQRSEMMDFSTTGVERGGGPSTRPRRRNPFCPKVQECKEE